MMRSIVSIAVFSACWMVMSVAQAFAADPWADRMGKLVPLNVSTPATGVWAAMHPYDETKFGKIRGFSPPTEAEAPCLMIYTRGIGTEQLKLLSALDELLVKEKVGKESYVTLFDSKGAQRGSYTASEVTDRIEELAKLAKDANLRNISIGIAANASSHGREGVGLIDPLDTVIVVIKTTPAPLREEDQRGTVAWYRGLQASKITSDQLKELLAEVKKALTN